MKTAKMKTIAEAKVVFTTEIEEKVLVQLFNKFNLTKATLTLENNTGDTVEFDIDDMDWGKVEPVKGEGL